MNGNDFGEGYDLPKTRQNLAEARKQVAAWQQLEAALEKLAAGIEGLNAISGPLIRYEERTGTPPGGRGRGQANSGPTPFKGSILAIITELGNRRGGVSRQKLVEIAKARSLKEENETDEQFDARVQYALNGLKVKEEIRSAKRGHYKPTQATQ